MNIYSSDYEQFIPDSVLKAHSWQDCSAVHSSSQSLWQNNLEKVMLRPPPPFVFVFFAYL